MDFNGDIRGVHASKLRSPVTPRARASSASGEASPLVPPQSSAPLDRVEARASALPRAHMPAPEPTPEARGLWARLVRVFREHPPAVGAVMAGASALPALVGAPTTAWAQEAPRGEAATPRTDTTAVTSPRASATSPATTPTPTSAEAVDLARVSLFGLPPLGPTDTSLTAPDLGGLRYDRTGWARLDATLEDGRRVNLLPSRDDVARWLDDGSLGAPGPRAPVTLGPVAPGNVGTTAARPRDAALDSLLGGVPAGVRESPWSASFDDYFRARAAVSEVPTALAGAALRPVADGLYRVVDEIPAPIRRPFDRALGILLDNAVSLPANALTTRIPITSGPLPGAVDLGLPAYPQMQNSCGETMIATWLKAQGVPIALGEVDTQTPFFEGTNLLVDAELRNRGFSLISGPGTMEDLRTYLAHGYPVMVSVGWPNGGGHYAVVTGYDESTRMLTIDSYNADGQVAKVPYDEFAGDWGRHANLMTVAHPQRDARLGQLRAAGRLSRTPQVQEGLSISDAWVNQRLQFFVEAAYRYRGTRDDLTVRLNVTSSQSVHSTGDMFGGSLRYSHRFDSGTTVDFYAERVAIKSPADSTNLDAVLRSTAVYVGARHGPVSGRAGYERGSFQAQLQAELNRRLYTLGAEARVSVGPDGRYSVFLGATGTF